MADKDGMEWVNVPLPVELFEAASGHAEEAGMPLAGLLPIWIWNHERMLRERGAPADCVGPDSEQYEISGVDNHGPRQAG